MNQSVSQIIKYLVQYLMFQCDINRICMKMLQYWMNLYVYTNGLIKSLILPVGNVNSDREKVASHHSSFLLNPFL